MINYRLQVSVKEHLPWVEYIVDFGWVSESGIWCYVINRQQDRAAIVYIPISSFMPLDETPMDSVIDLTGSMQVLHQWDSPYWIPVTHSIHFLEAESAKHVEFIMTMTAPNHHEHLFHINAQLDGETLVTQLTSGDWNVSTSGIDVDVKNKLIYFQGMFSLMNSCIFL